MGGKVYYYCGGQGRVTVGMVEGTRKIGEESVKSVRQSRKVGWVAVPSSSCRHAWASTTQARQAQAAGCKGMGPKQVGQRRRLPNAWKLKGRKAAVD